MVVAIHGLLTIYSELITLNNAQQRVSLVTIGQKGLFINVWRQGKRGRGQLSALNALFNGVIDGISVKENRTWIVFDETKNNKRKKQTTFIYCDNILATISSIQMYLLFNSPTCPCQITYCITLHYTYTYTTILYPCWMEAYSTQFLHDSVAVS